MLTEAFHCAIAYLKLMNIGIYIGISFGIGQALTWLAHICELTWLAHICVQLTWLALKQGSQFNSN